MSKKKNNCFNLVERIKESFFEIDNDVCIGLKKTDSKYAEMHKKILKLQNDYPELCQLIEEDGEISLSAEAHEAFKQYQELKFSIEDVERYELYIRGHKDGFAYLKHIGAFDDLDLDDLDLDDLE